MDTKLEFSFRINQPEVIHYLLPEGCVHVYGEQGVPWNSVSKCEMLPLKDMVPGWEGWRGGDVEMGDGWLVCGSVFSSET